MIAWLERFDPAEMLRVVEELQLTNLQHVPTVLQLIAQHPDFASRNLSSLQLVAWGGAALPLDFVRFYRKLGVRLFTIYGMTETCGNATFSQPEDDDETLANTVGRLNPDAVVRVVDDNGNDVALGEEGEVWYKHHARMLYYLNKPEATEKTLDADGFLHTGDLAVRLPNDYLRLVGRKSEMFKSGGLNVYPREIELEIEKHPSIAAASVVGVPDATYSEVGAAFVSLVAGASLGENELRDWCKSHLAGYKVPKTFTVLEEFPMLPIGKVDKQALKKMVAK
jgi:acyl-CoA synthetase (AMP-forming)/AMP-acid ligase II